MDEERTPQSVMLHRFPNLFKKNAQTAQPTGKSWLHHGKNAFESLIEDYCCHCQIEAK